MQPTSYENESRSRIVRKHPFAPPQTQVPAPPTGYSSPVSHSMVQRAAQDSNQLPPNEIMAWQRTAGNRAVAGLLGRNGATTPAPVQRKATAAPSVGVEGGALDDDMAGRLRRAQNGGSSMPDSVRSRIEPSLGADLSSVKVHTGSDAVQLTSEMGAKAFTHKNHIFYGAGHSPSDLKLTAHEAVHTIQQGAVKQTTQRKEDDITGVSKPVVARTPAKIQRLGILDRLRRRRKIRPMTAQDLVSQKRGGQGGSLNRVDKVEYNRPIGKSKSRFGFFKPNQGTGTRSEDMDMARHAVGSSVLDKWLGLNVLSEDVFAQHGNERGVVSAAVSGTPLQESIFDKPVSEDTAASDEYDPVKYKNVDDQWYEFTHARPFYHNYADPRIQKGMFDLQLIDAITGQLDRHGGNIFIDDSTGSVKGIDNDQILKTKAEDVDTVGGFYHGLPGFVDERTAKKVLSKKAKNLPKVLGQYMSPEDIKLTQERMRAVKRHLKQLKKEGKLVREWNEMTYLQAMEEQDKQDFRKKPVEPSLLKRAVKFYNESNDREEPEQNDLIEWEDSGLYNNLF